jgi:hypothetical protein
VTSTTSAGSGDDLGVGAIPRWLVDEPREDGGGAAFMRALAERLVAGGFPLWRMSSALMTMHPEVLWRTVQWHAAEGVTVRDQPHARLDDPFYTRSAVAVVRAARVERRLPRDGAGGRRRRLGEHALKGVRAPLRVFTPPSMIRP